MLNQCLRRISPLSSSRIRQLGLQWFLDQSDYFADELLSISQSECDNFYHAGQRLIEMFDEAVNFVIQQNLWKSVGIPPSMHQLIKFSFTYQKQYSLISRFDFAGGLDNLPLQLLEYNADIVDLLPETALVQQELLSKSNISHAGQFNYLQKDLIQKFKEIKTAFPQQPSRLLISTFGHPASDLNADFIGFAAENAGFEVVFAPLSKIQFTQKGVFLKNTNTSNTPFFFWYKNFTWDYLSYQKNDILSVLEYLITTQKLLILNPPHTMLYQSKGLLKYLWDLNVADRLLLKTDFTPKYLSEKYACKSIFGREGENISLYKNKKTIQQYNGGFSNLPTIYQDFAILAKDNAQNYYQPNLYYINEPSALCFRRKDSLIIDDESTFVGHFIEK